MKSIYVREKDYKIGVGIATLIKSSPYLSEKEKDKEIDIVFKNLKS